MKTLTNPFFVEMEKGARKAEKELGIKLIVRTGAQETSIEQQISIIEEMIESKVDAIIIAPSHSMDLIPVLKKAQDANIPIVNIDNRLDPDISEKMGLINVPFISIDNEKGAYLAVKALSKSVTDTTKVAIIEGITGTNNSYLRKRGAVRAFKEIKNIDIVALESANWKIDEAYSITSNLIKKYPDLGIIYCANDMMALGAIECLTKEEKTNVLVGGFDAIEEAKKAIIKGRMQVTVKQYADTQGYVGVIYAANLIKGEKVPKQTYIPIKVLDKKELIN